MATHTTEDILTQIVRNTILKENGVGFEAQTIKIKKEEADEFWHEFNENQKFDEYDNGGTNTEWDAGKKGTRKVKKEEKSSHQDPTWERLINYSDVKGPGESLKTQNESNLTSSSNDGKLEKEVLEFINTLPHTDWDTETASNKFGHPYLPDEESVAIVEKFWNKDNRKIKYLAHLVGNYSIKCFIEGTIDTKTCVGFLRSMATAHGCGTIFKLARLSKMALAPKEEGNPINTFSVDPQKMLASMRIEDGPPSTGNSARRPESLHPVSSLDSGVYVSMKKTSTQCVTLDWVEASKLVEMDASRAVAALTNLICALIMPAYTLKEMLSLGGEAETAVLREHCLAAPDENLKDSMDEMCVLACINSLVQYFSGSSARPTNAPLRLPPFGRHPIINLKGWKYFYPDDHSQTDVVASLSAPSQSSISLIQRMGRRKGKILCEGMCGAVARILPDTSGIGKPRKRRRADSFRCRPNSETYMEKRRDPFIHMTKRDRPIFMRAILTISGSYGWFSLVVGYTSTSDTLFAESNVDDLFPPQLIRRHEKGTLGSTPLRNRDIDLRFHGYELTNTPGFTSCFRIRPESLCKGEGTWKPNHRGRTIIKGESNLFYTQLGYPCWYEADSLSGVFGNVELSKHVEVFDGSIQNFYHFLDTDNRWLYNLQDKLFVLDSCLSLLKNRERRLKEAIIDRDPSYAALVQELQTESFEIADQKSNAKRRQLCNEAERVIEEETARVLGETRTIENTIRTKRLKKHRTSNLVNDLKRTLKGIALYRLMMTACRNNCMRFLEAEIRLTAQDLYRYMCRMSARLYFSCMLLRGMKLFTMWHRPCDKRAFEAIREVPRCRIPHLVARLKELEKASSSPRSTIAPGMEILKTRDINPRPIRHLLLSILYGEPVADDISTVNCLEWLDWCVRSRGDSILMDVKLSFPKNEVEGHQNEKEGHNIIKEIIREKELQLHRLASPLTRKQTEHSADGIDIARNGGEYKMNTLNLAGNGTIVDTGTNTNISTNTDSGTNSDTGSDIDTDTGSCIDTDTDNDSEFDYNGVDVTSSGDVRGTKKTPKTTPLDKKPDKKINTRKYCTGRLGLLEVCTIAWTSLPNDLSAKAKKVAEVIGVYPIKI
uniref:Wsv226-like protein n=1 Tax=Metapenaeus ensis nimavirus TaxID=2133794 RepID=A0A401IPC8_9VIRU|nr:MAG: wsv226-like protein [Metapenaeus ensis nimavirus]GBG35474.1 wsv226-like protein [Metapenaeus ensis nimavirus]